MTWLSPYSSATKCQLPSQMLPVAFVDPPLTVVLPPELTRRPHRRAPLGPVSMLITLLSQLDTPWLARITLFAPGDPLRLTHARAVSPVLGLPSPTFSPRFSVVTDNPLPNFPVANGPAEARAAAYPPGPVSCAAPFVVPLPSRWYWSMSPSQPGSFDGTGSSGGSSSRLRLMYAISASVRLRG